MFIHEQHQPPGRLSMANNVFGLITAFAYRMSCYLIDAKFFFTIFQYSYKLRTLILKTNIPCREVIHDKFPNNYEKKKRKQASMTCCIHIDLKTEKNMPLVSKYPC